MLVAEEDLELEPIDFAEELVLAVVLEQVHC
jgi:hypothetical protein